jgi:ubiquinone/menaquinone biosynthesis C-methylase UbiE
MGDPELDREEAVRAFYGGCVAEQWTRFDRYARVEQYVLNKALRQHLPDPPLRVVDIGGGNGRHGFHLAEAGYDVALCDITQELLDDAAHRNSDSAFPLSDISYGDARKLPWPDEYARAGLMCGPMYCIAGAADRADALREARRVLSPGAPLFVQFLSRIGALRTILEVAAVPAATFDWQSFMQTGEFTESRLPDFFKVHYFSLPDQAQHEIEAAGFHDTVIYGMDGPASIFGQRVLVEAPQHIIDQWGEIAWTIGSDPNYRCASTHLLAVTFK